MKMLSNNLLERTKQRDQQIPTEISRLLKQVVNEAGGEKNTGGVTLSPAKPRAVGTALSRAGYVEDFFEPRTKLGFVFSGDSGGCSKFLPARPQGAGRLRRTLVVRRREARD
jgi:hypothetical protein